ncbi:MAG TPA: D-alanine--D-alanine ligase [Burkholderiaceae bacterium]|jgi:D-alanine-D-alanine ligase|nr:D-alanine--D-alanine ligase [Burkholderiaceae bacterium]
MHQPDPRAMGKVAVLFGGRSAEREISLRSGSGVLAALQRKGVDAHPFDPADRALDDLRRDGFERAFIALHGRYGEDGTVQGALELLRIPYTGSGVLASAIAMDKVRTKEIWTARGLSTPPSMVLRRGDVLREVPDHLGLPLIVKPPHEGSTLGVSKVVGYSEMNEAFETAARYDDEVLAEAFIEGPELTVAILGAGAGAQALPVIEIRAPGGNYDFENKYNTHDTQYLCPAPLADGVTEAVQALAVAAYRAIGCAGWGRVDLMLRARDNQPFLLEVNTSPGMTDHSLVPMAARAVGLSYEDLVLQVLAGASLKIGGAA